MHNTHSMLTLTIFKEKKLVMRMLGLKKAAKFDPLKKFKTIIFIVEYFLNISSEID